MNMSLSYEQFAHGWQAVFVALRPEVISIMQKLREQGTAWWCSQIPTVFTPRSGRMNTLKVAAADHIYLSQEMGMRKPEARIYQVFWKEGYSAGYGLFR
jgi:putative hydrolase of the HAD superfamily